MRQIFKKKKFGFSLLCALLITALTVVYLPLAARADNVIVDDFINPELTLEKIFSNAGSKASLVPSSGTLNQGGGTYTLSTNSYVVWEEEDHVDFAYLKVPFNYGSSGNLTVEVNLQSFDGLHPNASAGIMLRSSLNNNASNVFLHQRPGGIMQIHRMDEGNNWSESKGPTPTKMAIYPVGFKVVLSNSRASCYYRMSANGAWTKTSALSPMILTEKYVYVGVAAHTSNSNQTVFNTAVFNSLRITTDAPEGYEPSDPGDPGDPGDPDTPVGPQLPEDPPLPENVEILLRETFTDDDMFNAPATAANPVWKSYMQDSNIITNSDHTNRYYGFYYTDDGYFIGGDQRWTDYSLTADITFPTDFSNEENTFKVYVRQKNYAHAGYNQYAVTFTKGSRLQLQRTTYQRTVNGTQAISKASAWGVVTDSVTGQPMDVEYNYQRRHPDPDTGELTGELYPESDGLTHMLRVDCFDNRITVYLDGKKMLDFTDDAETVHTSGGIGFGVTSGYALIDNILVRKLIDPVGGDYDNSIKGRYNDLIPDYLQEYEKQRWVY